MHALRNDLLSNEVKSTGISLKILKFPADVTIDSYAEIMKKAMDSLIKKGYSRTILVIFFWKI
jgi:hypothetical protein